MQKYLQKRNLTLSASDATLLRFVPICQVIDQEWRKLGTNIKFGSKFIFEFIFFDHLKMVQLSRPFSNNQVIFV